MSLCQIGGTYPPLSSEAVCYLLGRNNSGQKVSLVTQVTRCTSLCARQEGAYLPLSSKAFCYMLGRNSSGQKVSLVSQLTRRTRDPWRIVPITLLPGWLGNRVGRCWKPLRDDEGGLGSQWHGSPHKVVKASVPSRADVSQRSRVDNNH